MQVICGATFLWLYGMFLYAYILREEIQINSKSNYKWNTKILMYLDNDVHVGSSCNLIILHD